MGTRATYGSARRREQPHRDAILLWGALWLLAVGCGGKRVVLEPGAALLHITTDVPSPTPAPDELRVWAYDDEGRLWDGVRVPERGALGAASAQSYGTLLVQPGAIHGPLRLHVRALASGTRVMDGVASISEAQLGKDTIELRLSAASLPDGDGDDVPDTIDDCLTSANPAQGGCASGLQSPDAGAAGDAPGPAFDGDADDAVGSDASARDGVNSDADASPTADAGPGADASPAVDATGGDASPADVSPHADASSADATSTKDGASDACSDACGTPRPDKTIGQACTSAAQCISGFCADGVCCITACNGACQSCSTGACLPVKQGNDAPECTGRMTCNKKGDCVGA